MLFRQLGALHNVGLGVVVRQARGEYEKKCCCVILLTGLQQFPEILSPRKFGNDELRAAASYLYSNPTRPTSRMAENVGPFLHTISSRNLMFSSPTKDLTKYLYAAYPLEWRHKQVDPRFFKVGRTAFAFSQPDLLLSPPVSYYVVH